MLGIPSFDRSHATVGRFERSYDEAYLLLRRMGFDSLDDSVKEAVRSSNTIHEFKEAIMAILRPGVECEPTVLGRRDASLYSTYSKIWDAYKAAKQMQGENPSGIGGDIITIKYGRR